MPRDHAQLRLEIWSDDDFRTLSGNAQHLYFILLTSPHLSYCGVTDWRPARLTGMVGDWTIDTVRAAAAELVDRLYVVIDEGTEEVLVRTFVRHDGLMKMPKMATAMATAHTAVGSVPLREVVVWELQRLYRDDPGLNGWRSERASALLSNPSVDPSTYPCGNPYGNPPGGGSGNPTGNPTGNPKREGSGNPTGNPIGNPTASPYSLLQAPNSETSSHGCASTDAETPESSEQPNLTVVPADPEPEKSSRRKPSRALPADFTVTPPMREWSRKQKLADDDVDRQTEKFRNNALAKDVRYADWTRAWQNWINQAVEWGHIRPGARRVQNEWERGRSPSGPRPGGPQNEWEYNRR